jgi:hypothetical protein
MKFGLRFRFMFGSMVSSGLAFVKLNPSVCAGPGLAHGREIQCLADTPKGAIFRITHLKLAV